jgi:hypothetical protein
MRIAHNWRAFASGVLALVLSSGCDSPSATQTTHPDGASSPPRTALLRPKRELVALPPYGDGFKSAGEYIQVSGMPGLDRVNEALRRLVLDDLAKSRRVAPPRALQSGEYPGEYMIGGAEADFTAGSAVVSVMIPASFGLPGGNPESYWLSLTQLVPSAEPVSITDLLKDPAGAFAVLERATKKQLRTVPCIGADFDDWPPHVEWDTAEPYSRFSLSPAGLVLGFGKYQVGAGACGSVRIVVPWSELNSLLTEEALGWLASLPQSAPSHSVTR